MGSSSIVIKVKFGETLRRFNAPVHDKKLALDIVTLREKIRSFFSFDSDVDFTLIYVDEDGDAVTLADDDDLRDVVQQSLNPLRITVKLSNGKNGGSSGASTPLRSPQEQLPFQTLNSGVSEILKSVPEPLRDVLSKLPLDLASKATSSAPVLTELVEKMKATYLNQLSDSIAGPTAQAPSGGAPGSSGPQGANSESSAVKDGKVLVDPEGRSSNSANKEGKLPKVAEDVKLKDVPPPTHVDLNVPYFENEAFEATVNTGKGVVSGVPAEENKDTTDGVAKKESSGAEKVSGSEKKDVGSSTGAQSKPVGFGAAGLDYFRHYLQDRVQAEVAKATNDSGSSSGWPQGVSSTNEWPFVGMPLRSDSALHSYHSPSRNRHSKRSHDHGNGTIFHRGVICDGCGSHPIIGARFKSKVKEDYDLCSVCFARMGNVADYLRIDWPAHPRHHMPFKGFHDPSLRVPPPTLPHALRAPGTKLPRSKLDSRFILDVNVLDGTIMAPFTRFTKIWRMRNNGTIIWPQGSQLQWIGGDRLSNSLSVEVEIPMDGLPVDDQLDIAVDFTAPELPGRYVSYWRMASPSGQKFGQRVWVLIQVDASMKDLGETSINLNLPPLMRNSEVVADQQPLVDSILPENNFIGNTATDDAFVDSQPKDHQEMNFPINDTLIIGSNGGASSSTSALPLPVGPFISSVVHPSVYVKAGSASQSPPVGPAVSSGLYPTVGMDTTPLDPITYPTMGGSEVLPTMGSGAPSPTVPVSGAAGEGSDDREQGFLRELDEMGFKQLDLNKEILRMNNYDLEKSVDDLCGVSEWDPMLDELQEMGFEDNEANRRLLKKNNGSMKHVVMDLINGERA